MVDSDRARIAGGAQDSGTVLSSPDGSATILRRRYPAFEGPIANGPHLRIGLSVSGSARLVQHVGGGRLEGSWRRGAIVVTPPGGTGEASSSPVDMIGLALLPSHWNAAADMDWDAVSHRFHADPLLASVLTALCYEAEAHGASTAFFEHGVSLIVKRLADSAPPAADVRSARPLSAQRLARVRAYVDAHLGDDLSVTQMAAIAGMDPSGFTRALRARTGLAPYRWLTMLRMERAAALLAAGASVMGAANAVGYANAGKFAAAFRRITGMPPSDWRPR
ncbi:helix-turn-helix domain-containing protein [Sphingomonas hengshuiensis]|uniref:helix-turn-helix domain-containing protein n=1 Tax=Sphingomonas hengshuiensis TaxID=1609977 RepID=UPI0005C8706C|nr:AraC family transcriptional regulator [Sphingomonas hengshuiensis]